MEQQRTQSCIIKNHFLFAATGSVQYAAPFPGDYQLFFSGMQHFVHFRRTSTQYFIFPVLFSHSPCNMVFHQDINIDLPHLLRLDNYPVRMHQCGRCTKITDFADCVPVVRTGFIQHKIRNIYKSVCVLFQVLRIKKWMYAGNVVIFIIRIMYKYQIRPAAVKIIICIPGHRYIVRILVSLIMHPAETSVRIPVIVGNRNHVSVAVFIRLRRFPHTFQRIPHRRLIRQKYRFQPCLHPLHAVRHLSAEPAHVLTDCFRPHSSLWCQRLRQLAIQYKHQLTVFFQP